VSNINCIYNIDWKWKIGKCGSRLSALKIVKVAKLYVLYLCFLGLVRYYEPKGGMFLWLEILGIKDTYKMVMEHGIKAKILLLPGREFMADKTKPCPYLRASFSVIPEDQIEPVSDFYAPLIFVNLCCKSKIECVGLFSVSNNLGSPYSKIWEQLWGFVFVSQQWYYLYFCNMLSCFQESCVAN